MNNYIKISFQIKEKIANFSKKISFGLSIPNCKFILDMCYGLISSSSSYLSEIARSLKEEITLKKVIERLSNRLKCFDENNRSIVWENYVGLAKEYISSDTVFCFDPGDIGKKFSKKLEYLDAIKDGSTGEYINGYKMIEIAALTKNEKLPIPIYSEIFSTKENNFISENNEYIKALEYVYKNFGSNGVYALDRGFDDERYFKYFSDKDLNFVIRMKKNRNVILCKNEKKYNIKNAALQIKCKQKYLYKDKYGITREATTGYTKVKIPNIGENEYYLVVIKSSEFKKEAMMLLTNLKPGNEEFTKIVSKVYIKRWKIEEYFRFKKQEFKFEKMLVRTLNSIRAMNMILSIVIGFIGIFSDNQKYVQYMIVFEASESLKKNSQIVLVYYAIARGLNKILRNIKKGIKKIYSRENSKFEQCIMPEFTNFNYFTS